MHSSTFGLWAKKKSVVIHVAFIAIAILAMACETPVSEPAIQASEVIEPTATPSPIIETSTPVPSPTLEATAETPTALPTDTPTVTLTPMPTHTATVTNTSTSVPTATETPSPFPTGTEPPRLTPVTNEPTMTPIPTATPTPSATATATVVPTPTIPPTAIATSTPKPTATHTSTPTKTPKPKPSGGGGGGSSGGGSSSPQPTVAPTSTPTPTATPSSDQRYGVVLHSTNQSETEYFLDELGLDWYLKFNSKMSDVPSGKTKVPFIRVPTDEGTWGSDKVATINNIDSATDSEIEGLGLMTRTQIANMVQSAPGAYWYVFGEANRHPLITGELWAPVFHYFIMEIKDADPTAKIIGTSTLNWDFQCIGCGGYAAGEGWLEDFVDAYEVKYGEKPPVDIWAIDVYPLDWTNTPNGPQHATIATSQLEGMRAYLDSTSEYANTPIWITEIAIHVGYDGWQINGTDISPVGDYHWDEMGDYLIAVLDWLEDNASANKIEKWFFFTTWKDIVNVGPDGYMGIIFFDDDDVGADINCLGEIYRSYALDQTRLRCDSSGNVAPQ